jgi:ribosome-binding factor A
VSSRRLLKAAEAVREVVSLAILTQVRDPRVRGVTVTQVEMDADMRGATVHVSVMGSPAQEELALRGLASSAGFLQALVAERIDTRYTPRLRFQLDPGVKKSIEIARVLREVLPPDPGRPAEDGGAGEPAGDDTTHGDDGA